MVTIAALLIVGSLAATALFVVGVVVFFGLLAYDVIAGRTKVEPQVAEEPVYAASPATAA
jgi:hypothetical protein